MEKIKTLIKKYKVYLICIIIILLSIISLIIQMIERNNSIDINSNKINKDTDKIGVYITGEVVSPGVYYIEQNLRLYNLIDLAGGLTLDADANKLNLAIKLNDSDKIIVPKKANNSVEDNFSVIEEKEDNNSNVETNDKININKADLEELMDIPGVGEATAKKIIEYRKNNYFNTIEDIKNVSGIGEVKYSSLKDSICVE